MYSDLYLQKSSSSKAPLVFVVAISAFIALIVFQGFHWYSSVQPTEASSIGVSSLRIVNKDASSFEVFIVTDEAVVVNAYGGYFPNKMIDNVPDLVRKDNIPGRIHIFTFDNLEPSKKYYFQFITNNKLLDYANKTTFDTTLLESDRIGAQSLKTPVYGRVVAPSGRGLANAYILIYSQEISNDVMVSTKDSGEWLAMLSDSDSRDSMLNIDIYHENYPKSNIKSPLSLSSPLQKTITIGKNFVFPEVDTTVLGVNAKSSGLSAEPNNYIVSITFPREGAIIPDSRPLIKGFGIPRNTVDIEIDSKPLYRTKTVVDSKGVWIVEPDRQISAGRYNMSITTNDLNNIKRTLRRNFIIAKSGEQVLGENTLSTPSATLTQSTPAKISISPSPTSLTPTIIVSDSPTPSPSTTQEVLKQAGSEFPGWLPMFGVILTFIGFILIKRSVSHTG
jgi:hypothetical protein